MLAGYSIIAHNIYNFNHKKCKLLHEVMLQCKWMLSTEMSTVIRSVIDVTEISTEMIDRNRQRNMHRELKFRQNKIRRKTPWETDRQTSVIMPKAKNVLLRWSSVAITLNFMKERVFL